MSQQQPAPEEPRSVRKMPLPVSVGAEPARSPKLQAKVDHISQSDTYFVTQRDRNLFAWLSSQRDSRLNGFVISNCYADLRKSCRFYQRLYSQKRGHLYTVPAPVIYAELSQYGNPTTLLKDILRELGNPFAETGRLAEVRERTWGTLAQYKVKLLVLGKADFLKYEAFNELIELMRNRKIAVLPVGTLGLYEMLTRKTRRYSDISNTFLERYEFPSFKKVDTAGLIQKWEEQVLKDWSKPLNLHEDQEVADFLYLRSGGHAEALYDILRKIAVWRLDEPSFDPSLFELATRLETRDAPLNL